MKRDKSKEIAELRSKLELLKKQREELVAADPFWHYEASDGSTDEEGWGFLRKWLKEEDIPQVLGAQLQAHESEADIIAVGGGNQSGKSTFGAIEAYIQITKEIPYSLRERYPKGKISEKSPQYWRVVGVDHKTILNTIIPNYQKWCPKAYLKKGKWAESWSAEQMKLFLYRGDKLVGTIEFMTNQMNAESFQGPPLDGVVYDEEPRKDIYKENLLRFTTSDKLRLYFVMTPTKGLTWVKDEIFDRVEDETGNHIETFKLCSVGNKRANTKVLNEAMKGLDSYEEIRMRLLGDFVSISGFVYGHLFSKRMHVIDPFPITKEFIVYRGVDPHLVKPSVCVEMAVDREENEYVIGVYSKDADTGEIKKDLKERVEQNGYRIGWTMCDKSADSTITVLGDRNIYKELSQGDNFIPALFKSDKFTGSINAGVDIIKQKLRIDEKTGKPKLFFFNIPENRLIINAMETMERDYAMNEDLKGVRDKINEGKHDTHACLRYIHQRPIRWLPEQEEMPEYEPVNTRVGY
jgi:phage terminase large subunit-like protein